MDDIKKSSVVSFGRVLTLLDQRQHSCSALKLQAGRSAQLICNQVFFQVLWQGADYEVSFGRSARPKFMGFRSGPRPVSANFGVAGMLATPLEQGNGIQKRCEVSWCNSVNCEVTRWGEWRVCSADCGAGLFGDTLPSFFSSGDDSTRWRTKRRNRHIAQTPQAPAARRRSKAVEGAAIAADDSVPFMAGTSDLKGSE
ncbi:unnamed protein product [Cladocopium goreaui]|uniref:Uncharacterized protein n=1 Tax=Cladocopium goreaui TaxID=2562237 RepID=A0A9P1GQU2_9DINO|nr:unnamed protein product [Cladocopium goreaui]